MMKEYHFGIVVGRFQILHRGHEDTIKKALDICDRVAVFIGSAQESGTAKNPLDFESRKRMLRLVFGDSLEIYPINDIGIGNNCRWGEYVLQTVIDCCGEKPDVMISGSEQRREAWFEDSTGVAEYFVPKCINISATKMIQFLAKDDRASWNFFIADALRDKYDEFRETVLPCLSNEETSSI